MLKGFNINGSATGQDVVEACANGARLLRYQILPGVQAPPEHWDALITSVIQHLDTVVFPNIGPAKIILDMHSAPGGVKNRKLRIISEPRYREAWVNGWKRLANHVKGYPPVLGYGIINEPAGTSGQVRTLQLEMHQILSLIHPGSTICVTCPHSKPTEFSSTPFIAGAWHEVHFYTPMGVTHQGLLDYKKGKRYPSGGFDKSDMIRACRPMLRFQQKYGAQIFVGEFSICSNADADSRGQWLSDCISLFDSWGWSWCYHAWREGPGSAWSPEGVPQAMAPLHASLGINNGV